MVPDILQPDAMQRINFEGTRIAVTLAFAGGHSGGLFSEALERATLAASAWDPSGFAGDLFLQRFATQCFKARIGGQSPTLTTSYLVRLLSRPPADPKITSFRRDILSELAASSELRRSLEKLYVDVCALRGLLENTGSGRIWDPNRRKLDILAALKEVIDRMATDFESSCSGLRRLSEFGRDVQQREPYRSLTDLLRYDSQLATLTLKVGIGADGRIRGFEVLSHVESTDSPFLNPFWRRWLAKLELFVRGYRFGDDEVMARLVDAVFTGLENELVALVQLFGDIEF